VITDYFTAILQHTQPLNIKYGLKLDKLRLFGDELKLHSQVVTQSSATLHVIQLDVSGIILVNGRLVFQSVAGLVLVVSKNVREETQLDVKNYK